jgi:hypothetical protein
MIFQSDLILMGDLLGWEYAKIFQVMKNAKTFQVMKNANDFSK